VYAMILAEKLEEEVERKGLIPQNQTRFRKGMEIIDNIYALNYLANRQISKRKGGMVVFFVDLKATFDFVDKEVLGRVLREREVREGVSGEMQGHIKRNEEQDKRRKLVRFFGQIRE